MLNYKVNSSKKVSNLLYEGIDIFSIEDISEEKISDLCNRISNEIGSLVEWYNNNNIAYVRAMECDVQIAVNVGKDIIFNEFNIKNIRYLKDKKLVSFHIEYKCIALFNMEDVENLKKWCKLISNTIKVVTYCDTVKWIISKRPFSDYMKIIAEKESSSINFNYFRFFNPMNDFVEKFRHSIPHNLIYNRLIGCTVDEANGLLESIILDFKYESIKVDAKKQLELDFLRVMGHFESISKVYYNKKRHRNRWIVIGDIIDNQDTLTKIMIVKK